ncbi:hypothetical protein B0J11DRAFT_46747 [Dendryphion nanum]|uniref:Uncharacterized protein n=1 Tax=Dendryphion nanum TaxID=256645 RepID=A0A9P9EHB8_9PLEO|nr:hypothetical protein B0J11DRAFT_46747 [Dendryphion nanum]
MGGLADGGTRQGVQGRKVAELMMSDGDKREERMLRRRKKKKMEKKKKKKNNNNNNNEKNRTVFERGKRIQLRRHHWRDSCLSLLMSTNLHAVVFIKHLPWKMQMGPGLFLCPHQSAAETMAIFQATKRNAAVANLSSNLRPSSTLQRCLRSMYVVACSPSVNCDVLLRDTVEVIDQPPGAPLPPCENAPLAICGSLQPNCAPGITAMRALRPRTNTFDGVVATLHWRRRRRRRMTDGGRWTVDGGRWTAPPTCRCTLSSCSWALEDSHHPASVPQAAASRTSPASSGAIRPTARTMRFMLLAETWGMLSRRHRCRPPYVGSTLW